jgi:hypothetical protein
VDGDLLCFSHLRWDFVFQRPNHLMSRAARGRRVVYVEEPVPVPGAAQAELRAEERHGVEVVTPHVPERLEGLALESTLRRLMDTLVEARGMERPVLWYYTPMALPWTAHLPASAVVYDCMDHLAGFAGAPPRLLELEARLLHSADVLFTGGARLHSLKSRQHPHAYCLPSSVDAEHFSRARGGRPVPADQSAIPAPRIGYAGVIDERVDLGLIAALAHAEPTWSVVLVGPVTKIDPDTVPAAPNIHRLGARQYARLPDYLAGWDVAIMPFAHNEATRYISPTKTPEYLAAGLPVASTSIHDVVDPYGNNGLVEIGDGADGFVAAVRRAALTERDALIRRVDAFLAHRSWDATWSAMDDLLEGAVDRRARRQPLPEANGGVLLPRTAARRSARPSAPAPARAAAPAGGSAPALAVRAIRAAD